MASAEILYLEGKKEYRLTSEEPQKTFDGIEASITPDIKQNQFTFDIGSAQSITVKGLTRIESIADELKSGYDQGTYLFRVRDGGSLYLKGNIDIKAIHPDEQVNTIGNNVFWATGADTYVEIGSSGTTSKAWALAEKPDLISAKRGAEINIKSTNNQFVGSVDFISTGAGTEGSKVSGTFSGNDSYWFGDDQSVMNSKISLMGSDYSGKDELESFFSDIDQSKNIPVLGQMYQMIWDALGLKGTEITDELNLTFKNGAQWTYFGLSEKEEKANGLASIATIPKRISSITLLDGGIINLFDKNIQSKWKEIGLLGVWSELADVNHDYVRIGDLKGSGGIFRLDLDAENKQNSDMIFIESSSDGGQHFIEPYNMELLESVSPTNTLTFALQEKLPEGGKFISFAEKQNIYGQSLFDYELEIDSRDIENTDQISDIKYDSWSEDKDDWDFNAKDYVDGKEWFIKRVTMTESAAAIGMRSAGYASYDLAVNMDRRDRRLQNAIFQNEEKDGLWARVQYGEAGAEHLYNADLTTVYVGYEKATSVDNRLGFSFAYTDGDSDFNDLKGTGELKRYEASVYDTVTFGSHYLDFVARFGQVDNEFDVTNQSGALTTTGSFDQKYAALSAEYGYNFKDEHNVFIEPQVQLQVAYLGDYNYRTERNMKVDADSDISVIGRVGLRAGKAFKSSNYVGELYARADVLHQFTDGQDAQFSDLSNKVGVTWGDKDTWSTFGVGGYLNWKDNVSFQVDVERTAGGETIDTWLVSGRVNYLF